MFSFIQTAQLRGILEFDKNRIGHVVCVRSDVLVFVSLSAGHAELWKP